MSERRFVVGYNLGHLNPVWGGKGFRGTGYSGSGRASDDYCQPMTEFSARRALAQMPCDGAKIFELVEIKATP